jgi:hypothetical protein
MNDPKQLVQIYRATNLPQAYFVRNLLLEEGIESRVTEPNEPLEGIGITPHEVLVRQADAARAQQVVKEYEQQQQQRARRPDWTCPACSAHVPGIHDECDDCGAPRPGSQEESPEEPGPDEEFESEELP